MAFTDIARNLLRDSFTTGSLILPICFAWGSGTTAATTSDITLGNEIGSATNPGSIYRVLFNSTSTANKEITFEGIIPSPIGSNAYISEGGIFTMSGTSTGSMFERFTHVPTVKSINEEWDYLLTLKFA